MNTLNQKKVQAAEKEPQLIFIIRIEYYFHPVIRPTFIYQPIIDTILIANKIKETVMGQGTICHFLVRKMPVVKIARIKKEPNFFCPCVSDRHRTK